MPSLGAVMVQRAMSAPSARSLASSWSRIVALARRLASALAALPSASVWATFRATSACSTWLDRSSSWTLVSYRSRTRFSSSSLSRLMRAKRASKTASAKPLVVYASAEYVDARLKPLDVTTTGSPTRTQLRTTHGATNPPDRIGTKPKTTLIIKLLDGMHESKIAFLNKVNQRDSRARIMTGNRND